MTPKNPFIGTQCRCGGYLIPVGVAEAYCDACGETYRVELIVNLTQHSPTGEQIEAGVFDLPDKEREELRKLLTFDELPDLSEIERRAEKIAALASKTRAKAAMIGGAPFLMGPLEDALLEEGIEPVYAFSRRVSEEVTGPDGTVTKIQKFRHVGFVRPYVGVI